MKMTSSHHWRTFTGRIVFFLIISLAAAGPDDTAASASADASPITEEYQKFAVSLKPSEVWYMEYLLHEWRLKTIVAERKPRSAGELAFAALIFIAMMYVFSEKVFTILCHTCNAIPFALPSEGALTSTGGGHSPSIISIRSWYKFTQLIRNMRELRISFWGIGDEEQEHHASESDGDGRGSGDEDGGEQELSSSPSYEGGGGNDDDGVARIGEEATEEHPHAD